VDPDKLSEAISELIASLLECSPLALRATKKMMLAGLEADGLEAAFDTDYPAYRQMLAGEDAVEGMATFLEKRKLIWSENW
jgi:enoyl-CoA hydratase/carnithine racemase